MKAKKSSKIISLLLAVLMTLGMLPISSIVAAAEEAETAPYVLLYSKTCKNSEAEKLYLGSVSTKYGNKVSLTKDGTLWLDGYDAGPIHAFGFDNFTIALKGDNKIYHDSTKHESDSAYYKYDGNFLYSAIMTYSDLTGHIDYAANLTIRSFTTENANLTITSVAPSKDVDFGNSLHRNIRAVTAAKLTLNNVNLSYSIDGKLNETFGASGIRTYSGLNMSGSKIDGKIINCQPDNYSKYRSYSDDIYGIWDSGNTTIVNSDVNIVFDNSRVRYSGNLCGIYNYSNKNIDIKNSNVTICDESSFTSGQISCGIRNYYYQKSKKDPTANHLNITDNSVVTIKGNTLNYGIYNNFDTEVRDGDDSAGVTVNESELNIWGVDEGIRSQTRGVDFVNAKVNIRSRKETIYGAEKDKNGNSIDQIKAPHGLRISGSSVVDLTSNISQVVAMVPYNDYIYGRSRIELSKGGKVTFNTYNSDFAENIMPMCDYVSLGTNNIVKNGTPSEYTLTDKDSGIAYTRYYGEKSSEDDILTTFSVAYVDNIDVRWNLSTDKVIWNKDISPIDTYILKVEGAANYGGTPDYKEIYAQKVTGNSYTLPKDVTQYFADTMYYRIKIIPLVNDSTPSETIAYSNERVAKKQVEDITVTTKNSTTVRWNAVEGANAYYYTISKYNEETATYEVCQQEVTVHTSFSLYSKYNKQKWFGEGKYKVSVKALLVEVDTSIGKVDNYINILGSGEIKTPLTVEYYSLDYGEYTSNKFTLTVERDGIPLESTQRTKLLAGDKIKIQYYAAITANAANGWYINSRLSTITKEFSDDNQTVQFTMPPADVTAYPLVGVDEVEYIEVFYDHNYLSFYELSDIEDRFNYDNSDFKDDNLKEVKITWHDDEGNIITNPSATVIDTSKNYIGEVTLYPKVGSLFTENSSVTLYDYLSLDTGDWTSANITNGRIENGCYIFTLYLINKAKVTVPRAAEGVYDLDAAITGDGITGNDLYSFCIKNSTTNNDTKNITITKAYVAREKGEVLFGDNPSVEINGADYSAKLELDGYDLVSKVHLAENVYLYSNSKLPKLNYESGTTFHATYSGTEIDIVKLTNSYVNSITNPNAVVYWQVNGGDVNHGELTDALVFTAKGSHYATRPTETELTVWVDNGPKVTYKYYAVDALYSDAYIPKLSVSSTTFTDYLIVEVANPLPNLEYCYETVNYDYKKDYDKDPDRWYDIKEYGTRIRVTKSCRVRLAAKTMTDYGSMAYTKETARETYMRDYGKPLLNLESGTAIHCTSTGVINDCVKLDATYLKTLDSNAKIAYQVNGGVTKYLANKNDYFELDITETPTFGSTTKITVWVDDGEKATYTYKTYSQSSNYDVIIAEPGSTEFSKHLNIRLESKVPNYKKIQYGIVNSRGLVSQFYTYNDSVGITLERKNGNIELVTEGIDTGATEIKLAFRAVLNDNIVTPYTASVYTYRLSAINGMATSVKVNENVVLNSQYPYYNKVTNMATNSATNSSAYFDSETGTLTLNGYGQGSIIADDSLNIRLMGNSTVNGYIKCDGDLYIYGSSTLSVQPLKPIAGQNDFYCIYATGKVQLSTNSKIDLEIEDRYSDENASDIATAAYGIYGKQFLINNKTSLNIQILNIKGANYGIYAKFGFSINTSGNIEIVFTDYSDATTYEQAPFYHETTDSRTSIIIENVGYIKLQHPLISETGIKNSNISIQPTNSSTTIYRTQNYIDTHSLYTPNYYITEYIKGVAPKVTPTASITGTVASSGSPSKPVTLEIYDSDGNLYRSFTLYGNHAKYEFKNIPVGTYTIKASKAGHLPYETTVVLNQYDDLGGLITLEMPSVSGTITSCGDEDDTVTVELWKTDGTEAEEIFTGKGYSVDYIFNNKGNGLDADAEYYVVAKKENHKDSRLDYDFNFNTIVERKGVDLWLTAEYSKISGGIILEETSDNTSAVNTAVIFIEDTDYDPHTVRGTVTYDELGRPTGYSANLLVDSNYFMTVYANGYKTYVKYISSNKYPITHNVMLYADNGIGLSLSGTITSEGSESADITITLTAKGDLEPSYETVVNGNNTTYLFTDISSGVYTLTVKKAGHNTWSDDVIITSDTNQVDVTLSKIEGLMISGNIQSFGSDTDDVIVQFIESGMTEPAYEAVVKGNSAVYCIENILTGTYTMQSVKCFRE